MTQSYAKNVATSAEAAAKVAPRAEFRVFGHGVIDIVKRKMWEAGAVLQKARKMPPETYFLSVHTNEANVKARDGLLDIKTKVGETPEGYEIFQPRGKYQFPVKREAIPNYLTSLIAIVTVILVSVMKMRPAFAYLGEPVMVLNIGSLIMSSALVATGLAKRLSLWMVLRMGKRLSLMFLCFPALNIIFGAFISATSAKTALLLPLFMVVSAVYGATGGEHRNNVGRNMVLQNLLYNNVSASAFITGSAANLLAAQMLEKAGAKVSYQDWLVALLPLAVIQCLIAWCTGTRVILPISREESVPHIGHHF